MLTSAVSTLLIFAERLKALFCIVLRLKICHFKAFNFKGYGKYIKLFYGGICGGFCAVGMVLGVRRGFTFCQAFLLSRNGVADPFTHRLNFNTIPNDNFQQNNLTHILIPPIPHFIIFTLINSKIRTNRR